MTGRGGAWHKVVDVRWHLDPGGQQFRQDNGVADPRVTAALAAYLAGRGSEQAALTALAAARLLVPVVAVLAGDPPPEPGEQADRTGARAGQAGQAGQAGHGRTRGDKDSEMVLPTLVGHDGRPAVPAFTGLDSLARWRPDARPVPAEASRVWRAAVADGCAVVIDVAGPVPIAVEGARLHALAAGRPVPAPYEDPDVLAEVEAAVAGEPMIAGFALAPGHQADLAVRLRPAAGQQAAGQQAAGQQAAGYRAPGDWQPAASRVAHGIAARLAGRLRRGIEFSVEPIGS